MKVYLIDLEFEDSQTSSIHGSIPVLKILTSFKILIKSLEIDKSLLSYQSNISEPKTVIYLHLLGERNQ